MGVYPTFQVKLFDSRSGLRKMEEEANAWLQAAAPHTYVVDRQMAVAGETPDGAPGALERYVVLALWYRVDQSDD